MLRLSNIITCLCDIVTARSAKTSAASAPVFTDMSGAEEGNPFCPGNDPPAAADQEANAEIHDELHNKLNWLTVCVRALLSE